MSESELQIAIAEYIARQYPKVQFHSDFGSGVKLTAGQARINSRQNAGRRGWPDLFIAEYNRCASEYGYTVYTCGLFLELKKDGTRLHKKNGEWANNHIEEQAYVLSRLWVRGYVALFAVGFDEAKRIIDLYLSGYNNDRWIKKETADELVRMKNEQFSIRQTFLEHQPSINGL